MFYKHYLILQTKIVLKPDQTIIDSIIIWKKNILSMQWSRTDYQTVVTSLKCGGTVLIKSGSILVNQDTLVLQVDTNYTPGVRY